MAMRSSRSIFDRLPEEIILMVLHKLPVGTLVCCTWVSKCFRSLIRNPSFIYSYHANTASDNESFISLRWCTNTYPQIRCSFNSGSTGSKKEYVMNSSSAFGILPGKPRIEAVGSCNGLICLRECSSNRVLLWNPLIMRSFILPETPHFVYQSLLGFGFASKDNDCKVLIVDYDWKDPRLYSLKLNSWRSICSAPDSYIIDACFPCAPMVFAGGSLHYIKTNYLKGEGFSNSIVAFDLGNEVLRTIALPETLRTQGEASYRQLSISEYNGSTSIAVFANVRRSSWLHEIWMMREYGAEGSWLKLSFEDVDYLPRMPIFYFRTNERVHVYDDCPLAYDIDRTGTVSFRFRGSIKSIDDCRNKPLLCYKKEDHQYYFYACRHSLALLDKVNARKCST